MIFRPRRYELKDMVRYFNDWLNMGEKDYKYVFDLKYSPITRAVITVQTLTLKKPFVCWGLVEIVSDLVDLAESFIRFINFYFSSLDRSTLQTNLLPVQKP